MSETSEPSPTAAPRPPKPDRLFQIAAWVAIISGSLVIVLAVLWFVCAFLC